jgi:serine-type D-Ala-D-Ala carboxypeptidase (penicillin-binding protein 5/6)
MTQQSSRSTSSSCFLLLGFLLFVLLSPAQGEEVAPIPLRAKAYLVKKDGVPLWAYRERESLPPASLTKMMTALLALELGRLEKVVVISPEAAAETGSRIGLRAGDQLTLNDLLQAMLIKSANDAAHAVAEAIAGSTGNFIVLMNSRAAALQMTDTHYADVSGHDFADHYTSARDLAILAETAMQDPRFRQIVATQALKIRTVDAKRTFRLHNSNRLIGILPEVTGIKTGYTRGAGRCLVSMAERDGSQVLVVLLNDTQRWSDAPRLFDQAFDAGARKRVAKR